MARKIACGPSKLTPGGHAGPSANFILMRQQSHVANQWLGSITIVTIIVNYYCETVLHHMVPNESCLSRNIICKERCAQILPKHLFLFRPEDQGAKSGHLKSCEGPLKCQVNSPNGPLTFLLILNPACKNVNLKEMDDVEPGSQPV